MTRDEILDSHAGQTRRENDRRQAIGKTLEVREFLQGFLESTRGMLAVDEQSAIHTVRRLLNDAVPPDMREPE